MAMSKTGWRRWVPPVTASSLLRHYLPLTGAAGHYAFGLHVLNPGQLPRLVGALDVAVSNSVLFNAHLGVGLFVYYRSHMNRLSQRARVVYSCFASIMFNFGSVLIWAVTKAMLPSHALVRCAFALLTSYSMLAIGREYLAFVDGLPVEDE